MKKYIPNAITCLNLFAGCVACVLAFKGLFTEAFLWIMLAAVMDFLDGVAARLLNAYSPLGKELDSLADVISFGFAPGLMVFVALQSVFPEDSVWKILSYLAFLIPIFSALRLAKFNIDERQSTSFIGLPTPANAMFWFSAITGTFKYSAGNEILYGTLTLCFVFLFSWLLVSEIPMFSLKVKNLNWKENGFRYILIACSLLAIVLLGWSGIAAGIVLYILMSLCMAKK